MHKEHLNPLKIVNSRGCLIILGLLAVNGELHPSELQRQAKKSIDLSHTTLSKRLKELVAVGYVKREVLAYMPPSTVYSLTEVAKSIGEYAKSICENIRRLDGS